MYWPEQTKQVATGVMTWKTFLRHAVTKKKNWWSEKGSGYLGTWNLGLGARGLDVDEGLACSMRNGPGQSLDHRQSVCQCRRVT